MNSSNKKMFVLSGSFSLHSVKEIIIWITSFAGMTLALLLAPCQVLSAAEILVAADRNPVSLEESFHLVFSTSGDVDDDPDFTPLDKDFERLGTQESSQISIINGRKSSEKKWIVTLLPKHSGKITVPPIAFGRDRSHPATISVKQSGDDREKGREIFIEIETDPEEGYVQQQIGVNVRVFRSIAVANATLSPLTVSGVNSFVEQLANDKNYRTRIDERVYDVYERHYALYPQESGKLIINPVRFQATTGFGRFFADPFGDQPKSIIRRSVELTVNVSPVPALFTGKDWLPAKSLQLEEQWSQDPPEFRVGEPVTRTITLSGRGLLASQLPELQPDLPDSFKAYPDQPVLKNESLDKDIVGIREEKIAIIPTSSGRFTLPEIRIPYWSVGTETMEHAVIPARTIEVLPSLTGNVPAQPLPQSTEPVTGTDDTATIVSPPDVVPAKQPSDVWQWVSGVLLFVWMLTLWFWWRAMRRSGPRPENMGTERVTLAQKAVQQACRENNPDACKRAMLQWASVNWRDQPPRNLGEISRRLDDTISDEIDALNDALYSRNQSQWDGESYWQAFSNTIKNRKPEHSSASGSLEPMFRIS